MSRNGTVLRYINVLRMEGLSFEIRVRKLLEIVLFKLFQMYIILMIKMSSLSGSTSKQILIDYDVISGLLSSQARKASDDGSPEITESMIICIHCPSKGG